MEAEEETLPPPAPAQGAHTPIGLEPAWVQPEVAWPLALLAGFAGTYVGVGSGIPAMGTVLAAGLFAPLYVGLLRRDRLRLAAVLAMGWLFAVGAACGGLALDRAFSGVATAIPGAWSFRDEELRPWLEGGEAPAGLQLVLRNALVAGLLLAAARPTAGLGSLLGLAAVASAVGAGVGWFADLAAETGGDPLLHVLTGIPPHYCFQVLGVALIAVALGRARALLGPAASEHWRQVIVAGCALLVLGLVLHPLLASSWGSWLAGSVAGGS